MTERIRTLVVDDEKSICFFLKETLQRVGHTVITANSGEEALDLLRDAGFDLAMLDLRLGGRVGGLRVLEAIKWLWPDTVVIILTAHGSLESAIDAIREGVDGYLLKPVGPDEVRRAVREALARRERLARLQVMEEEGPSLQRGPFSVDLKKHLASSGGRPLDLTPREFRLLVHLMQNDHRVISPKELVQVVQEYEPEDQYSARESIKWYIYRLRRKVEPDPSSPSHILNVRGVGYRFSE